MKELWIRVDRREDIASELERECRSLEKSVEGLRFDYVDPLEHADGGAFRDFAPAACAQHEDQAVLEWVAEELVDIFGWKVDVGPDP